MSHIKWAAFKWFIRDSAPNGDGSSSLFYTVNNCFTSITNQPTNGLLFTKFCKKMCYISQQHDKNREEKEENRVLPVGLVKYIDFVKLGVKVFQGRNRNEASHVSHISVDDSSSITGAQCTWKERSLKIWYSKWNNHINNSTTTLYLLYSIIDCW